jgi:hypothetical protein
MDSNDTPYVAAVTNISVSQGGCTGCTGDQVMKLSGNSWSLVGPVSINPPYPVPTWLYYTPTLEIDRNGMLLMARAGSKHEMLVKGWNGSSWISINSSSDGWDENIRTYSVDLTFDNNNRLLAVYTNQLIEKDYGSAYVLGYNMPLPPAVGGALTYCQNDTASMLTATGQNLLWYTSLSGVGSSTAPTPSTSTPGIQTYYVSQSAGIWTSNKDSIIVTVNPSPTPTTTLNGTYLQSSGPYVSYQWYLNGNAIGGATSNTFTPTAVGAYHVEVTDTNGCAGSSTDYNYTPNSIVSVKGNSLVTYPNPVTGNYVFVDAGQLNSGSYDITIYNVSGKLVYRKSHSLSGNKPLKIDIGNELTNGVYYLSIKEEKGESYRSKFVVIR